MWIFNVSNIFRSMMGRLNQEIGQMKMHLDKASCRAGHFWYFLIFSLLNIFFFCIFIKLIWLGVGFLNRTGAEIASLFDKKWNKIIFYYWTN